MGDRKAPTPLPRGTQRPPAPQAPPAPALHDLDSLTVLASCASCYRPTLHSEVQYHVNMREVCPTCAAAIADGTRMPPDSLTGHESRPVPVKAPEQSLKLHAELVSFYDRDHSAPVRRVRALCHDWFVWRQLCADLKAKLARLESQARQASSGRALELSLGALQIRKSEEIAPGAFWVNPTWLESMITPRAMDEDLIRMMANMEAARG